MNLEHPGQLHKHSTDLLSIPKRDLMNLEQARLGKLLSNQPALSIPKRDLMNLELCILVIALRLMLSFNP